MDSGNNPHLPVSLLMEEARAFATAESSHPEPSLYGKTDGKAVGTYFEQKFHAYLEERYAYDAGSSAKGVDFPGLNVDMKVTSAKKPQSSCPFKSAQQKIYGLGYGLLVFVYDKTDDAEAQTGTLKIVSTVFVEAKRTADFQTTSGLREIIKNAGNKDDILAFIEERRLPVGEIEASRLADQILKDPPELGCLTISSAWQWRLHYRRAIDFAGTTPGVHKVT